MELGYPIAAVVAAVPATLAWLSARTVSKHVGKSNGNGTLNEVSEALLLAFEQHAKLDDVRFKELSKLVSSENVATRKNTTDAAQNIIDSNEQHY